MLRVIDLCLGRPWQACCRNKIEAVLLLLYLLIRCNDTLCGCVIVSVQKTDCLTVSRGGLN